VGELLLARALWALAAVATHVAREPTSSALHGNPVTNISTSGASDRDHRSSVLTTICLAWLRRELPRKNRDVLKCLDALRSGETLPREWRAPLYRSRRIAAINGDRAAIHFALPSILFVMTGWPATESCLALVAITIGLGTLAPDPVTMLMIVGHPSHVSLREF
jgi:hypothetical protein